MLEEVIQVIKEKLNTNIELQGDTDIAKETGADSLDYVEMVLAFEERFNINIDDKDIEKLKTPNAIVEYIESKKK